MKIQAPELDIATWLNTDESPTLAGLRGKVVVLHAFQMLCPACVRHAIPQTARLHRRFADAPDVAVIGLHTVFEDHEKMTEEHLRDFVRQNDLRFPIGIDRPGTDSRLPNTMSAYHMQGTPTLILIDRNGDLRLQHFGVLDDLGLGILLGRLL